MYFECQTTTGLEYPDIVPKGMERWGWVFRAVVEVARACTVGQSNRLKNPILTPLCGVEKSTSSLMGQGFIISIPLPSPGDH